MKDFKVESAASGRRKLEQSKLEKSRLCQQLAPSIFFFAAARKLNMGLFKKRRSDFSYLPNLTLYTSYIALAIEGLFFARICSGGHTNL